MTQEVNSNKITAWGLLALLCVVAAMLWYYAERKHATEPVKSPSPSVTVSLRDCVTEDDPGPCIWHAKTQGNGQGTDVVRPSNTQN